HRDPLREFRQHSGRPASALRLLSSTEARQKMRVVVRNVVGVLVVVGVLGSLLVGVAGAVGSSAVFVYPTAGAQSVDTTKPFSWTAVSGALAYYLKVGTTRGGSDLVNSGETQATSWSVPALPAGQTLWARISTKRPDGTWPFSDVSFTAQAGLAKFVYPTAGAQ